LFESARVKEGSIWGLPARAAIIAFLTAGLTLGCWTGILTLRGLVHDALGAELTPTTFIEVARERKSAVVHINNCESFSVGRWENAPWPFELFRKDAPLREHLDKLLELEISLKDWRSEPCSGFIIDAEGHILTSHHIASEDDRFKVSLLDGDEYEATLVGKDARRHVALLKIDADRPLPFIPLGNSDALEVGQWVVVLGNPLGSGEVLHAGIVNATARPFAAPWKGGRDDMQYIMTEAASHQAVRGGPLLNLAGEAVGLNIGPRHRAREVGLAVPINAIKAILEELKLRGEVPTGWLGITVQELTPPLARYFQLSEEEKGVLVAGVEPGSPAEQAGLKSGDLVVTFDGEEVVEPEDLSGLVAGTPPGKQAAVEVIREGKPLSLTVTVGGAARKVPSPAPAAETIGLAVRDVSGEMARRLDMREPSGVEVTAVDEDSRAARAGLRRGDVIVEINRATVADTEAYKRLLAEATGESVLLLVKRRAWARFVVVQLD